MLQAAIKSYKWSILLLALSATLREGIESVLFLTGVSQVGGGGACSLFRTSCCQAGWLGVESVLYLRAVCCGREGMFGRAACRGLHAHRAVQPAVRRPTNHSCCASVAIRPSRTSHVPVTPPPQGDGIKSIIIPGIVGVILGLALGMLIFYT